MAFNSYYLIYVLFSAALLYHWRKKTESPQEKKQAQIIITAVLVSVVLIFINETLLPLLGVDMIPKVPSLLTLLWAWGMWYAISKYRLLDLSPALTGEIVLEELLRKLLQTLSETSNAQRVVIILSQEDDLLIQGEAHKTYESQKVLHNIPLQESSSLPHILLQQIQSTCQPLLLDDVVRGAFGDDPYLCQNPPSFLLIIPLLSQGLLQGLFYMESHLTNTFTLEQAEAVDQMGSQIVVSLENASLFANLQKSHDQLSKWNQMLEETVAERTMAIKNLLNHAGQGFPLEEICWWMKSTAWNVRGYLTRCQLGKRSPNSSFQRRERSSS